MIWDETRLMRWETNVGNRGRVSPGASTHLFNVADFKKSARKSFL